MRLAAEIFPETLLPLNLAAFRFEANEVAVRAECVDEISVDGRSGPGFRIVRVLIRVAYVADARGPDNFSIIG